MVVQEWGEFVYSPPAAVQANRIVLPPDEAHHLFRVRRVPVGHEVYASDGEGMVYRCQTVSDTELEIVESLPDYGEPRHPLSLCIAVLKGDTNRDVVDLATQLGVTTVIFFHATRCVGRLSEEKHDKLKRTAISSLKQTGRACLPKIKIVSSLKEALQIIESCQYRFLAHLPNENKKASLSTEIVLNGSASLVVGPEGGFTPEEVNVIFESGCRPLKLADNRLRSEVAVTAGLSVLLSRMDHD
ncbi:MAG: RsmE family RNA methyltransferase [Calditrichota bacterium]